MPKVTLGQWTQKDEQFTRNLKAELGRRGKDYKNLMRRTGRSQTAIHKRYNQPGTTTVDELRILQKGLYPVTTYLQNQLMMCFLQS